MLVAGYLLTPLLVFAQQTIPSIILTITTILNEAVIPLIIGIAFVIFLWGVYKYIYSASVEAKEGARTTIIYGLIGLFVMLAAWGLVNILIDTFFTTAPITTPPFIPGVPIPTI